MVPRYETDRVIAELPVQSARRGRIAGLSSQVEVPATPCEQEEQEYRTPELVRHRPLAESFGAFCFREEGVVVPW